MRICPSPASPKAFPGTTATFLLQERSENSSEVIPVGFIDGENVKAPWGS